jgi:integrase
MSKRNHMPGLRLKRGTWHIEKRCKYCENGWLRESTGTSSRAKAEDILITRLAEVKGEARRKALDVYTFEEAAMRYLEEIAHKASADRAAIHLDQLLPFIGDCTLAQVHDGTLKAFINHERNRGLAPKSVNNALAVVSAVLNRGARVWRSEAGTPWLQQAPPKLTRLSLVGQQAKPYPLSWKEQERLIKVLPGHLADAVLFTVNTGCRDQEVCQLRWDWEVEIPELETSVFILPETITKTSTERVVVLNAISKRVIDSRRGVDHVYVFAHRGKPLYRLHNSGWKTAWRKAGLPVEKSFQRGVHNLRHTFGRRLRGAGVPLETRKLLLGHASGDITTHYSAAEIRELIDAVEKIVDRGTDQTPTLTLISRKREIVGKVSEQERRVSSN